MSDRVLTIVHRATAAENIRTKKCFACGQQPSTGRGEHVFPLWLQNKHNLHHEKLKLLNETLIPYRQLTVPCCTTCNNGFLSRIERNAQLILSQGELQTAKDQLAVGRWLAKIFYALLVKETSLVWDRRDPALGSILKADFLEELTHCGLVFQSARKPTSFQCYHGPHPFTLYWYRIRESDNSDTFDLSTNVLGQSIALRSGAIGVVFVNDGGLQLGAGERGPFDLSGATVNAVQFKELAARIHYKATLRDATHFYVNWESDTLLALNQECVRPFSGAIQSNAGVKIFDAWDENHFSQLASAMMSLDQTLFFDPTSGRRGTLLTNLLDDNVDTEQ